MRTLKLLLLLPLLFSCAERKGTGAPKSGDGPVVLIGVDGADWDVMEPLIKEGKLPNFYKLMRAGSYGSLETVEPILSPIIWTTIGTGRDPEDHGVTWFMENDPKSGKRIPVSSRTRRVPAIWNIASQYDRKVGVVGWWASWPAETVNGWMISDHVASHGFGLRSDAIKTELGRTYPDSLLSEIEPMFVQPVHITDAEVRGFMNVSDNELKTRTGNKMKFSNPLHHFIFALATHKTYANLSRLTLNKLKPDLAMFYFEAVDSLSHLFMKYTDPPLEGLDPALNAKFKTVVPAIYQRQDQVLGEIIDAAGPNATIVVVSDHGFKTGDDRLSELDNTDVKQAHKWHEKEGVILMAGPNIKAGTNLTARVHDVTPTLLYLLDVPIAKDLDGRVLIEAVKNEHLTKFPIKSIKTYGKLKVAQASDAQTTGAAQGEEKTTQADAGPAEIDPALVERLQALGYVGSEVTPEITLNKARIAIDKGNFTMAKSELEQLLVHTPDYAPALMLKARIAERENDWKTANDLYERMGKAKDPKMRAASKSLRAVSLLRMNEHKKAEELLREVVKTDDDVTHKYHLALSIEKQKRYKEALAVYDELLKKEPKHALALNNAGHCSQRLEKLEEAKAFFKRAAEADPKHAQSRYNLANILIREGKKQAGVKLLEESTRISPDFISARWALAAHYVENGPMKEAERWLSGLVERAPKMARAWSLRARVAANMGDKAAARRYYTKAKSLNADVAESALKKDLSLQAAVK
jgi:predicted AlkP superfamily phosphohydrolase/phosphomutase/Tfp pilus assembly protein PilF